jgi:hypothetical protein
MFADEDSVAPSRQDGRRRGNVSAIERGAAEIGQHQWRSNMLRRSTITGPRDRLVECARARAHFALAVGAYTSARSEHHSLGTTQLRRHTVPCLHF